MFYVYLLKSRKTNKWYLGYTADLRRRIQQYNSKESLATKAGVPFDLIYYEAYLLKADAEDREKYLKTSMGRRVIRKQLRNYLLSLQ